MKTLSRYLLRLLGWTLVDCAECSAKAVLVAYPHTSNWDGFYALLLKLALGLDAHWVGKDALFRWPFGGVLRWLGGVPVNRRQRTGFVEQMAAEFASRQQFTLVMAPEGTRSLTGGWKTGFYRIALGAQVPVGLAFVDYRRREAGVLAYLPLTGDPDTDIRGSAARYHDRPGKRPELASPVRWLE